MRSYKRVIVAVAVFSLSILCASLIWAASPHQPGTSFGWNLIGTVLIEDYQPVAIIEKGKSGWQKWARVGDVIDGFRVTKITHGRMEVFNGEEEIILSPGFQTGNVAPLKPAPLLETNGASEPNEKKGVDAFLLEEFERKSQNPDILLESDRNNIVKEITRVFNKERLVPFSTVLVTEGGEELVTGMKVTVDIKSMGLQKDDLIIHINGIQLNSKERWEDILEVVKRAQLISFSYLRGTGVYSQLWEIR